VPPAEWHTRPVADYAASKTETSLYCVVFGSTGRPVIDASVGPIKLESIGSFEVRELHDCALVRGGTGRGCLLVTTNIFGGCTTYLVNERPRDETGPSRHPLDASNEPSLSTGTERFTRSWMKREIALRRAFVYWWSHEPSLGNGWRVVP